MTISFFIPGIPAPGGSKKAFLIRRKGGAIVMRPGGKVPMVVVTDAGGKANKDWKQQVAVFAKQNFKGAPLTYPLAVMFEFFRPRPKAHFRSNGAVKDSALALHPITTPDVTKLVRAAEDAMTGICWIDDSIIVDQVARKRYSDTPGLKVTITPMDEQQPLAEAFSTTEPAPQQEMAL